MFRLLNTADLKIVLKLCPQGCTGLLQVTLKTLGSLRHDGHFPVTNPTHVLSVMSPGRTARGHVQFACRLLCCSVVCRRPDAPLAPRASPSQRCDIECVFALISVRASAPACSGKLTRAEKGSVLIGGSAKTRLRHQKGENDVKLLKNPNTKLIINHHSHHSFIQTCQLGVKNRGEKQEENLVLGGCV